MAAGSILLQFAAAVLALRLIPVTGRRSAWVLISAGLFFMALRRLVTFTHIAGDNYHSLEISAEWIAFITSLFMLLGIVRIKPLFHSIKQSASALMESEKKYRTLFESCKDAIFLSTKEGRFLDVNQATLDLFGYSREEMIGMDVLEIYAYPGNRARFQEDIEKRKAVKDYPQVFLKKGGTAMDCLLTSAVLYAESGTVVGYQCIIRDVSEHNRLIELLESERQKFFSLLDEVPAFIDLRTPDHSIVYANRRFRETFGEPDGRPCHVIFHNSEVPCRRCRSTAVFKNEHPLEFEWSRPDGRTYKMHQYCHTEADGSKLILEMGIDITDLKQAEEERAQLVSAIEQAAEGILIIDKDEKIRYVNPAFDYINNSHLTELLGQSLDCRECDCHDASFHNGIRTCLGTGKLWQGRLAGKKGKERTVEIEVSISPIYNEEGAIVNCVVIERDATNEAKLEKQLRQAQKMEALGTLAGGISHDFNNILSILFGFTDMLLMDAAMGEKARGYLENIHKTTMRGKELVAQILAFSRQQELQRHPVQIAPIAGEALKLLRASLPSSIEIRQKTTSESRVLADSTQIGQIVMNLCTNAAHAMREKGGILEIGVLDVRLDGDFVARHPLEYPGDYVKISVGDTGHGMDAPTLERIFDPYFTTKTPGEGTGLGLAVVHGIVKSHGGMITVYSEPGKGTTFHVFLPRFQSDAPGPALYGPRSSTAPLGGQESLLLVDDEISIANVSFDYLETLGYRVTARTSSLEALEAFRTNPDRFDLLITDMTMPQMGGLELAKEIGRIRPGFPMILCTGFSGMLTPERLKAAGISRLVLKPVVLSELTRIIREILDEKTPKEERAMTANEHIPRL